MKFRERRLVLAVGVVSLLVVVVGCAGGEDALEEGGGGSGGGFVVGSANFPEQLILGNMYADVVEDQGIEVERRLNLGTRDVVFPSLESGEITLVPEYNGALLSYLSKGGSDVTSPEETTKQLKDALPKGLIALKASEAQDKDALVVTPGSPGRTARAPARIRHRVRGVQTAGCGRPTDHRGSGKWRHRRRTTLQQPGHHRCAWLDRAGGRQGAEPGPEHHPDHPQAGQRGEDRGRAEQALRDADDRRPQEDEPARRG